MPRFETLRVSADGAVGRLVLATRRQVHAVAEESGSTPESFRDAHATVGALRNEESIAVMTRCLKTKGR